MDSEETGMPLLNSERAETSEWAHRLFTFEAKSIPLHDFWNVTGVSCLSEPATKRRIICGPNSALRSCDIVHLASNMAGRFRRQIERC